MRKILRLEDLCLYFLLEILIPKSRIFIGIRSHLISSGFTKFMLRAKRREEERKRRERREREEREKRRENANE